MALYKFLKLAKCGFLHYSKVNCNIKVIGLLEGLNDTCGVQSISGCWLYLICFLQTYEERRASFNHMVSTEKQLVTGGPRKMNVLTLPKASRNVL